MFLFLIIIIIGEINSKMDFKYEKCDQAMCNNKGDCFKYEKGDKVLINCKLVKTFLYIYIFIKYFNFNNLRCITGFIGKTCDMKIDCVDIDEYRVENPDRMDVIKKMCNNKMDFCKKPQYLL